MSSSFLKTILSFVHPPAPLRWLTGEAARCSLQTQWARKEPANLLDVMLLPL